MGHPQLPREELLHQALFLLLPLPELGLEQVDFLVQYFDSLNDFALFLNRWGISTECLK